MHPQSEAKNDVKTHLQEALDVAENTQTKYHIREALQMTELSQ